MITLRFSAMVFGHEICEAISCKGESIGFVVYDGRFSDPAFQPIIDIVDTFDMAYTLAKDMQEQELAKINEEIAADEKVN